MGKTKMLPDSHELVQLNKTLGQQRKHCVDPVMRLQLSKGLHRCRYLMRQEKEREKMAFFVKFGKSPIIRPPPLGSMHYMISLIAISCTTLRRPCQNMLAISLVSLLVIPVKISQDGFLKTNTISLNTQFWMDTFLQKFAEI